MITEQIIGIVTLIIGIFGLIDVFKVHSKFLKGLRVGFAGIAFGILSGYFSVLFLTLHVFDIIPESWAYIVTLGFLSVASILIALGSNKISKILLEVNKGEKK